MKKLSLSAALSITVFLHTFLPYKYLSLLLILRRYENSINEIKKFLQ